MSGPAMAVAIGHALEVSAARSVFTDHGGFASNALGGAGGPLAVLFVAIITAEIGKLVSKETKVDILVTPLVTVSVGIGLSALIAPPLGKAAMWVGDLVMWATDLQPFLMGILVSVIVGIALTLPISSAAICAALSLTGLAGGAAVAGCSAQMIGFAVMSFSGEPLGRTYLTGRRYLDAPDAEYREESACLDRSDTHVGDHGSSRNLPFRYADERRCRFVRYGYLRICRSDRCLLRLG